jgi:hypothetical protein
MFLRSLEIKNFKSLEHVELDGLDRFNVLIGRNNSGKSAVIGALELLNNVIRGAEVPDTMITAQDRTRSLEMRLRFDAQESDRKNFFAMVAPQPRQESLLRSPLLRQIEFVFKSTSGQPSLLHLRTTSLMAQDGNWATIQKLVGNEQNNSPEIKVVQLSQLLSANPFLIQRYWVLTELNTSRVLTFTGILLGILFLFLMPVVNGSCNNSMLT